MKRAILLLIFLVSLSFAIEEKPVKNLEKPKKENYRDKDKDDDGIWDIFIKNILRKSEKKKEIKTKRVKRTPKSKLRTKEKKK